MDQNPKSASTYGQESEHLVLLAPPKLAYTLEQFWTILVCLFDRDSSRLRLEWGCLRRTPERCFVFPTALNGSYCGWTNPAPL